MLTMCVCMQVVLMQMCWYLHNPRRGPVLLCPGQIIRLRSSCLFVAIITKMNMQLWIASVTLHKVIPSHKLAANVRLGALPFQRFQRELFTSHVNWKKIIQWGLWRPGCHVTNTWLMTIIRHGNISPRINFSADQSETRIHSEWPMRRL